MKTDKENLLKHFASVLRGRAIGNLKTPSISKNVAKYFSRKELIEIIKNRFGGTIPKEHDLIEMENTELLSLIGDELFIISYITQKWSEEISFEKPKENPIIKKKVPANTKKKNDTVSK